jgi:dihydrofolate reductase
MTTVHFDISMSLDGFITGPGEGVGKPLGEDGGRLHDWMFAAETAADAEVVNELYARTGAIMMGRRMFDVGVGPWGDPPPFHGLPVFVLTHEARAPLPMQGGTTYTFVTGGIGMASSRPRPSPPTRTSGSGEVRRSFSSISRRACWTRCRYI